VALGEWILINSYSQGSVAGSYVVRSGDSLQGIAQNLWGDSGLWYKLAEANGLSGAASLFEGQTLRLPAGVMRNTYNASSVTPYNPAETLGDVTPSTPQAVPPKKQKCGGFGQILLAVIAIAITVIAPFGGGIIGGALNAAAGSVVSQVVGVATGIQEKFDWKGVATAFISGGVSGGLSGVSALNSGTTTLARVFQAGVRGAATSAISQGIGMALGLQDKFSWAGVAAAGVGGAVGQFGAEKFPGGIKYNKDGTVLKGSKTTLLNDVLSTGASLIANATTRTLIEGTDFGDNVIAALPDSLGGLVGRRIGGAIRTRLDSRGFEKTFDEVENAAKSAVEANGQDWSAIGADQRADFLNISMTDRLQGLSKAEAIRLGRQAEAFLSILTKDAPINSPGKGLEAIRANMERYLNAAGDAGERRYGNLEPWAARAFGQNTALLKVYSALSISTPEFEWTHLGVFTAFTVRKELTGLYEMYTAAAAPAELMGRLRSPNAHFVISANQIRSIFQTTIDGQLTVGKDVIPLALAGKVYGYKAMADYGVREWGQRNPRTLGYKLMQASMLATDPALASQSRLAAAREFAIHEQRNLNPMWSALKSESLGSVGEIAMWMGKTRLPIGTLGITSHLVV
jgi:hypothetical protein